MKYKQFEIFECNSIIRFNDLSLRSVDCHRVARLHWELLSSETDGVAGITRDDGNPRNEDSCSI